MTDPRPTGGEEPDATVAPPVPDEQPVEEAPPSDPIDAAERSG